MLNGPSAFSEKETNEVKLSWFPSHVLSKVCMFFQGWVNQLRFETGFEVHFILFNQI